MNEEFKNSGSLENPTATIFVFANGFVK
ncbi:Protein of unknown function [Bacillus cereus]|nr:Protein of unknown function [Bacillus cereus]